jgi:uncharacterized protein YjbI with pentapeptide repeats
MPSDIKEILHEHSKWFYSGGKNGTRAIFINSDLQNMSFSNAFLSYAQFDQANLKGSTFNYCNLILVANGSQKKRRRHLNLNEYKTA